MQRRQFNAWAAWLPWGGACAASGVLGGCGGGGGGTAAGPGDGDAEVVVGPLKKTLALQERANPIKALLLDSGSFLGFWSDSGGARWQEFSPSGSPLRRGENGGLHVALVQALSDGGFAFASPTTTTPEIWPNPWTYSVHRYAADGSKTSTVMFDADDATSVAALLPNGEFLAVSVNALSTIYGEPPLPTAYAQTQLQRHSSAGVPLGEPLRFEGKRGHWFAVATRPEGGYWLLRTQIASFGQKYTGAFGSQVWLERYDDSEKLQASTMIAAAADVPDELDAFGGDAFAATVRGMSVWATSDGGAVVNWVGGHVYYGPSPRLNYFFRRFNAAGQPVGPVTPLWQKAEDSSLTEVQVPELRADGHVDVVVTRRKGTVAQWEQRWTLETLDILTGEASGGPRLLLESAGLMEDLEQWQSFARLRDGSLAILARGNETSADGVRVTHIFMRRLSATGTWLGWTQ